MTVVFNVKSKDDDPDHVLKEYENLVGEGGRRRTKIAPGGFIFIDSFKNHVLLVQSVSTKFSITPLLLQIPRYLHFRIFQHVSLQDP